MSGGSSRSTLIAMKCSLSRRAIASFSKHSRSMTWHQWHVEYPMDRKMGLLSRCAAAKASSPHGYQFTGLKACCCKYGLAEKTSRLKYCGEPSALKCVVRGAVFVACAAAAARNLSCKLASKDSAPGN